MKSEGEELALFIHILHMYNTGQESIRVDKIAVCNEWMGDSRPLVSNLQRRQQAAGEKLSSLKKNKSRSKLRAGPDSTAF